jgi:hypothetical protein
MDIRRTLTETQVTALLAFADATAPRVYHVTGTSAKVRTPGGVVRVSASTLAALRAVGAVECVRSESRAYRAPLGTKTERVTETLWTISSAGRELAASIR